MRTKLRFAELLLLVVVAALMISNSVFAGIPEPPMLIYGSLQTSGGLPVTSGTLLFEFVPVGGGTTVRVQATVGSLSESYNFVAIVPNERAPVAEPDAALELGTGKTYTPRVYYGGVQVTPVQLDSPLTPERAKLIGPITYTVSPTGKAVSVSHNIGYGFVPVGSFLDRQFQVYCIGTEAIAGTARLQRGAHFHLMDGQLEVSQVSFNLAPGQAQPVTVRFEPTLTSSSLTDLFEVRTDGGDADRLVSGRSTGEAPIANPDLNGDGEVNELDLFLFLLNWQTQSPNIPDAAADLDSDNNVDTDDLLRFLEQWH